MYVLMDIIPILRQGNVKHANYHVPNVVILMIVHSVLILVTLHQVVPITPVYLINIKYKPQDSVATVIRIV